MSRMPTSDAGSTEPPPRSTRVLRVPADDVDPAELDPAARVLDAGGLVAFPTETVYGLGAVADDSGLCSRCSSPRVDPRPTR